MDAPSESIAFLNDFLRASCLPGRSICGTIHLRSYRTVTKTDWVKILVNINKAIISPFLPLTCAPLYICLPYSLS